MVAAQLGDFPNTQVLLSGFYLGVIRHSLAARGLLIRIVEPSRGVVARWKKTKMFPSFLPSPVRRISILDLPQLPRTRHLRELVVLGDGYAIAVYAAADPGAPRRYVAYAKACRAHPASYWEAQAFAKFASEQAHGSAGAAIADALDAALMSLANLGFIDGRNRAPRPVHLPAWSSGPVALPALLAA